MPSEDFSGSTVGVGDVNGDTMADFLVTLSSANTTAASAGQAYLLFGRNASTPWEPNPFELSALNATTGVTINGLVAEDQLGWSCAGVQDVNGDNIDDLVIGTLVGNVAYVIFGTKGAWPATLNLSQGTFNGFTIAGVPSGGTGFSVSGAGDVNNDELADIAIGVQVSRSGSGANVGRADVLYGRSLESPWPEVVNLTTYVNASTGFSVIGDDEHAACGYTVAGVGDVNGDHVDDVAIGCPAIGQDSANTTGIVAVVFGSSDALPQNITLDQLNGTNGFVVRGPHTFDSFGFAVSPVGDVNSDGMDDFAIGAFTANDGGGAAHVWFGRNATVTPWPARVNVSSLHGTNGFTLAGSGDVHNVGASISPAGDVNADGMADWLVGAPGLESGNNSFAFLVYGRTVWPASLSTGSLNATTSVTFSGTAVGDNCGFRVSLFGDVNGDARDDFAIACYGYDSQEGQVMVVFGPSFTPNLTASPTFTTTITPTAPATSSPNTPAPTTLPTTVTPTTSPTASTCASQGAFIPPGATCVNGVLVTTSNTTVPAGTISTVTTSVTITGGASFEQPSGSTLVFVAGSSGSTSVAVQGGGCAAIGGDAVVNFEADPSNSGGSGNTGTLVLVTADCVMGAFGSVSATTSFEGDECIAIGEGMQEASGNTISVSFGVSNTCAGKSSGLSTGALVGIVVGGVILVTVLIVVVARWSHRARFRRAREDVKMMTMRSMSRSNTLAS